LTIISTLTIGVPGFFLALAPGAPRAQPGFTRRVLAFTVPAGIATASAGLAAYAIARATPEVSATAARTAAMLAVFAVGLWVLALVAGRPAGRAVALVAAMAGSLALLFAVPQARQIFALELPPAFVCAWMTGVVLAAITGLTLWRRVRRRQAA
jgi:cation-transporting ATPase E